MTIFSRGMLCVGLVAGFAGEAAAYDTRDRVYVELGFSGVGPGIPEVAEGLALGGELSLLVQEDEGDYVLFVRPGFLYRRSIGSWGDDPRTFDIGGLTASFGLGIPDLGLALPYVALGADVLGVYGASEWSEAWDWGVGLHATFGVILQIGDYIEIRPEVGFSSLLLDDMDRPLGGLHFGLALGFDLDPRETYVPPDDDAEFDVYLSPIYPSGGSPGGATAQVQRDAGFAAAVTLWAEPPAGIQAVVLPDPSAGPDRWRILVAADPAACAEFDLVVRARGGATDLTRTVRVQPSCGTGGAP
jgi:hypothetical protein